MNLESLAQNEISLGRVFASVALELSSLWFRNLLAISFCLSFSGVVATLIYGITYRHFPFSSPELFDIFLSVMVIATLSSIGAAILRNIGTAILRNNLRISAFNNTGKTPILYSQSNETLMGWRVWAATEIALYSLESSPWGSKFLHAKHSTWAGKCRGFEKCSCGVYSLHSIDKALKMASDLSKTTGLVYVVGLVSNKTKVVVHQEGMRSLDVEIIALIAYEDLIFEFERLLGLGLTKETKVLIQKAISNYQDFYEIPALSLKGLQQLATEHGKFYFRSNSSRTRKVFSLTKEQLSLNLPLTRHYG
jgi:hypothetical protein